MDKDKDEKAERDPLMLPAADIVVEGIHSKIRIKCFVVIVWKMQKLLYPAQYKYLYIGHFF